MSDNITIAGKIMTPPELRQTAGGKAVSGCKFAAYCGKKGDKYNPSLWLKLVAWEEEAKTLMRFDDKERVVVTGVLGYEAWKNVEGKGDYTITVRSIRKGDKIEPAQDDFVPEVEEEDVP